MISGVGVDIIEVSRIERAMRHPRFRARVLTDNEQHECTTPQRVAGRWAAKEAIVKAVGVPMGWHDLEIVSHDGPPKVRVRGGVLRGQDVRIHLSISHEKGMAVAVAIIE